MSYCISKDHALQAGHKGTWKSSMHFDAHRKCLSEYIPQIHLTLFRLAEIIFFLKKSSQKKSNLIQFLTVFCWLSNWVLKLVQQQSERLAHHSLVSAVQYESGLSWLEQFLWAYNQSTCQLLHRVEPKKGRNQEFQLCRTWCFWTDYLNLKQVSRVEKHFDLFPWWALIKNRLDQCGIHLLIPHPWSTQNFTSQSLSLMQLGADQLKEQNLWSYST